MNVDYLKKVVFGYVTAQTDAEKLTLLSVIITMLHFNQEEAARVRAVHGRRGVTGWIVSKIGSA